MAVRIAVLIFYLSQIIKLTAILKVKSVTLLDAGMGYFPDAKTERGQKHLRVDRYRKIGLKGYLILRCPHTGITQVSVAKEIDPKYDLLLKQACDAGVEILCYRINISEYDLTIGN